MGRGIAAVAEHVPPRGGRFAPSIARVYDYALGGKHHFAADREAARLISAHLPPCSNLARDCRDLVRRVVTWLMTETDVDQIIDVGSGLPTNRNVHEIAREHRDGTRVVYVDNDPTVLAHGRALLARDADTAVVGADVRDPAAILDAPATRALIDPDRPLAVLVSCVLHHLHDADEPARVLERLTARLPTGTFVLVANFVDPGTEPCVRGVEEAFLTGGLGRGRFRPVHEHLRYFRGLDLVEPGLVFANDWRPDAASPHRSAVRRLYLAGLARTV